MDMKGYRRLEKSNRDNKAAKDRFKAGLLAQLERDMQGKTIVPVTLQFINGPWLYGRDREDGRQKRETELIVFMNQLWRYGSSNTEKREGVESWALCVWPDIGGANKFIHYHGFLLVHPTHIWQDGDFGLWWAGVRERVLNDRGVNSCYCSPIIQETEGLERFTSYALKSGDAADVFWYRPPCEKEAAWVETAGKKGFTVWSWDRFVILGGRPGKGFRVVEDGQEHPVRFSSLVAAKALVTQRVETTS